MIQKGFNEVREALFSGRYDMVILDEINVALHYGLISIAEIIELMEEKPEKVELVLTGRYAPPEVIERADLVTEFKKIKHYLDMGVKAREGIEI